MRKYLCCVMSFVLMGVLPLVASAATKRALVIGIGTYQDASWGKINGDRDVPMVVGMLREFGYGDIRTLVNQEATKSAIISAFSNLLNRCAQGDVVYIHFSGHGQRMTDVNGDEVDAWDETWVPYDAYLNYGIEDHGEKHLSDDEIGIWMTKIRQRIGADGEIVLVVDACHSGDSSRELEHEVVRGVIKDFVIPNVEKGKSPKLEEEWLTLSACKSFQRNCEVRTKDGYYGMLTYALYTMRNAMKGMDNVRLLGSLKNFINQHRGALPQSPVLTGNKSKYNLVKAFY